VAKPNRIKAKAQINVPQNKGEAAADIKQIGDLQRQITRTQTEMNDAIAHITATYQPVMEALCKQVDPLRAGVQAFCEANRVELCGKGKTANLVTGEVQWRQRPPSVTLKAVETVIKTLLRLRLKRFVRVKMEVNKEAILLEPDAVKDVLGITVVTGVEDFVITPFEQEVAA